MARRMYSSGGETTGGAISDSRSGSGGRRAESSSEDTRRRLLDAAVTTLHEEGYAGATARGIAARANANQALIFYHFGGVKSLLLAALEASTAARLERYREAFAEVDDAAAAARTAAQLFAEDHASGHVAVLTQMVAAGATDPDLGPAVVARLEPFRDFTTEVVARLLGELPLGELAPPEQVAETLISFYLGLELLTHLDGDVSVAQGLFDRAAQLADLATMLGLGARADRE